MKKYFGILCCILLFNSLVIGQEINVGIKGGINYNLIGELYHIGTVNGGGNNVIPFDDFYFQPEKKLGNHFGIFLNLKFDKLFFKSELNVTSSNNSYVLSQKTANWTSSKFDIPLFVGLKVYDPVWIYTGPVFNIISDMELEGVEYAIVFNKSSVEAGIGILVDFDRFGIDFRYQYGISSVKQQRIDMIRAIYGTNVAQLVTYNPSQLSIAVHINLLKNTGYTNNNQGSSKWRNHINL